MGSKLIENKVATFMFSVMADTVVIYVSLKLSNSTAQTAGTVPVNFLLT